MDKITEAATQYFKDLKADGKEHCEENLSAWLWFTCDALIRKLVRERIEIALKEDA